MADLFSGVQLIARFGGAGKSLCGGPISGFGTWGSDHCELVKHNNGRHHSASANAYNGQKINTHFKVQLSISCRLCSGEVPWKSAQIAETEKQESTEKAARVHKSIPCADAVYFFSCNLWCWVYLWTCQSFINMWIPQSVSYQPLVQDLNMGRKDCDSKKWYFI